MVGPGHRTAQRGGSRNAVQGRTDHQATGGKVSPRRLEEEVSPKRKTPADLESQRSSLPQGFPMSHAWRALGHRNFRLFFVGQTISLVGTWMTRLATTWLVYRLTHSAL